MLLGGSIGTYNLVQVKQNELACPVRLLSANKQNMAVMPNLKNILAPRCSGFRPFVIILVPLLGPFMTGSVEPS